jgi:hypothetical protein
MFPDLIFQPVWPWPLLAGLSALAIAACAFAYHQQRALASRGRRAFLLLFRLAGVASILFILLRPMMREATPGPKDKPVLFVAVDHSLSMNTPDVAGTTRWATVTAALRAARARTGGSWPATMTCAGSASATPCSPPPSPTSPPSRGPRAIAPT